MARRSRLGSRRPSTRIRRTTERLVRLGLGTSSGEFGFMQPDSTGFDGEACCMCRPRKALGRESGSRPRTHLFTFIYSRNWNASTMMIGLDILVTTSGSDARNAVLVLAGERDVHDEALSCWLLPRSTLLRRTFGAPQQTARSWLSGKVGLSFIDCYSTLVYIALREK